jgi:N-carbamoyl-L-amino-acid hydrolase
VEQIWRDHEARGIPMAATIGRFHTDPAQHGLTIVPGAFELSLDLRAYTPEAVAGLEAAFRDLVATLAAERGVRIDLGPRASAAVGPVDPEVRAGLERAAAGLGVPVLALGSPASHDAAAFAAAGVKMGMIFVRNANGSHNPEEAMTIEDFLDATAVLTAWLAEAVAA